MSFKIIGTGSALPYLTVSNEDLATFLDTSDEWIGTRTGIRQRHILSSETLAGLGAQAAEKAMEQAGIAADGIDLILCSTVQGDTITPGMGCVIQGLIGASCPAFDMNAACSGFIYALDVAAAYLGAGKAKRILVVCTEGLSRMVDWQDRATCVLFGDAAGAVVLEAGEDLLSIRITVNSNPDIITARPQASHYPLAQPPQAAAPLHMEGQEVYKFAVTASPEDILFVARQAGIDVEAIDLFLLHQANLRIIEAVRTRLKQPPEKFPHNIENLGNTSSASIPVLLDELNRSGQLRSGQLIALSAFGAGLSTGACLIRWSMKDN